jgi:hypothetical protein
MVGGVKALYAVLLALVVGVGCGEKKPKAVPVNIANPLVEKAIRESLNKPTDELTKADLEKVKEMASKWEKWPELARVKPWPWKVD